VTGRLRTAAVLEAALDLCVFLLLPLLVLFPLTAATLAGAAGLCAFGLAAPAGFAAWRGLRRPALLLAALLAWGLLSSLWAVQPGRSLLMAARLLGLFAGGLALIAAAPLLAAPGRLVGWLCGGLAVALVLTAVQDWTLGALTRPFVEHVFDEPRLNHIESALVLLVLPLGATLVLQRRRLVAALLAVPTAAAILLLVGDAARLAFLAGIGAAAALYVARRSVARLAAALGALVVLLAPLIFPPLLGIKAVVRPVEHLAKISMWHRLEIWNFVGARIAERPLLGWGLDSSRAIPGGNEVIPFPSVLPLVEYLPLHPHNMTLQIWLELGLPGALLCALLVALPWLTLATAPWPRLYAAAAGGSLTAAFVVALGSFGLWQEWWIGTEFLALFAILAMARALSVDDGAAAARGPCRARPAQPMP